MGKRKDWRNMKEIIKAGSMVLGVLLLVCCLIEGCNYLVVDDTNSYTRLTLHELYESDENVETLFLGTSHCFRAYDPDLYEQLTGESAFNLGSSSQNIDTSYYLLKEAIKYHDIKKVYLDIYHEFFFFHPGNRELIEANIISDYMRPSLNKLQFILSRSSSEHYTNSFFPFRRDWQLLGDFDYLKENVEKKRQDNYKNYEPVVYDDEHYVSKGFVESIAVLNTEEYSWIPKSDKVDLSEDSSFAMNYLEKIVKLCKKENIEIVFLTAPSYKEYIESKDSYDMIHDYVSEIADSFGVSYVDFNLYPEEILPMTADDFMDVDHLNGNGADKVTYSLAEYVLNQ